MNFPRLCLIPLAALLVAACGETAKLPFEAGVRDCTTVPHSPRCFAPIAVPAGKLLLLGDHRSGSADSVVGCRSDAAASDCARLVDVTRVTGKVIARAWPPGPVG